MFYSLIYILKEALPQDYYEHLLQYILFLRILTKDKISNQEINFSRYLIVKFMKEFETSFYGTINLKYNLHAHLHLPDQVAEMGPLHKSSAFAGEGAFLLYGQNFNGTVNICNQIVNKLNLKSENNKFLTYEEISKIKSLEFKQFANKLCASKKHTSIENQPRNNTRCRGKNKISFDFLPGDERALFIQKNIAPTVALYCCNTIYHKQNCKYSLNKNSSNINFFKYSFEKLYKLKNFFF